MAAKICFNCTNDEKNLKNIQDLDPVLVRTIKRIVNEESFITYEVVKSDYNSGGSNFLADLIIIDIKGKTVDSDKEISLFIKKRVYYIEKIELADYDELYLRELFAYTELSKIITHLQDKAKVPDEENFKFAKVYDGSVADLMICENLAKKGFKTYGRFEFPPLKFMALAIKELAKFHGLSFVIENEMPDFYQNKIKSLKSAYHFNDDWKGLMEKVYLRTANLFDDEKKKKLEEFLPIAIKKYPLYDHDQTTVKCCLTHMDYKINNIMVREIDGEPVEVVPIDFQLIDYGCPLRDFLFFIFSCTSREFRKMHLTNLKDLYFETLTRFLKYFDMNVEDVYPREEFEKTYKQWLDYGLIKTLFASVFLFAPETGLNVRNLLLAELPFDPDRQFEERARGWIEDFMEWGYL